MGASLELVIGGFAGVGQWGLCWSWLVGASLGLVIVGASLGLVIVGSFAEAG